MDFLDPKAKKRRGVRLGVGYVLTGILILIATTILVFNAYGFDVDRKTGEVIQNGLAYIDSAPSGATIRLNGKEYKDRTNTRITLQSGGYDLSIYKNDYRDWNRAFSLEGGEVQRLTYPLLIPKALDRIPVFGYESAPSFVSESPDRRWVITSVSNSLTSYIQYDLNTLTANKLPTEKAIAFPAELFTKADGGHSVELVEWSNDNKHLLVKHSFAGGQEFVVLNRDVPTESININKLLNQNPGAVSLIDKKYDKWYLLTNPGGQLATADAKTKQATPLLSGVGAYKSHGEDTLLYTMPVVNSNVQRVMIRQGNDTYAIREISAGTAMLDIARYDSSWYIVIGSATDKKTYVYKNPQTILSKRDKSRPVPSAVLRSHDSLTKVGFSQNTRFVSSQSGQHFEVYDAEYKKLYRFNVAKPFDPGSTVTWMDGHRLSAKSGGTLIIFDFDGSNLQDLVASIPQSIPMFDRDYTLLYSVGASSTPNKFDFVKTNLRAKADQ